MKDLLTNSVPLEFGITPSDFHCNTEVRKGQFSLTDSAACQKCKLSFPERANCDEKTLTVHAEKPIELVNFESYISQWDNTPAKRSRRCDYIMWENAIGSRKVVFCDITCSVSAHVDPNPNDKHPEGKRQYAYGQMRDSLDVLLGIMVLEQYLLTATKKVFLFGWRDPDCIIPPQDKVEESMNPFMVQTAIHDAESFTQPAAYYGFDFVQVKYPFPYEW